MKHKLLHVFVLASGLYGFEARANDIEPTKEFYTAVRAPAPIVIDGNLSEWSGAPVLSDPKSAIPKGSGTNGTYVLFEPYQTGTWSGPDDQTSAVQSVYDDNNIYLGVVVTDDTHQSSATGEGTAWNGDSVQLMIASEDRTLIIGQYNYGMGGTDAALGTVYIHHEVGPAGDPGCACATEAVIKRDSVGKKTYYEIKIPAGALGLTAPLTGGIKFGLGICINDGDAGPGQDGQKGWGGLGTHSIVNGKTPGETALVTLASTVTTVEILGTGTGALLGRDLTDPENDGNEAAGPADPSWNWKSITASHEPFFNGAEGSFNIFDNVATGGGAAKWCCDDPTVDNPVWVAVEFGNPVSLTHFTVTSGNDTPDRDPTDWAIQGSTNGTSYTDIYHFTGETVPWTARDQVVKFTLPTPSSLYKFIRYIAYETPGTLHQIDEIEYFGTVGGADRFFLSAINPGPRTLKFRATDAGASIVDAASAKLTLDAQTVPLTSAKTGTATDFTGTYAAQLTAGSTHNYVIDLKDTLGNTVTETGSFTLPLPFFPSTNLPSLAVVNKAWRNRFVFAAGTINNATDAINILKAVGTPEFTGAVYDMTNEVVNFAPNGLFANPVPYPDDLVNDPAGWTGDDFVQFNVGNIDIPEAGDYTFGVHSDDGFAMRIRGGEVKSVAGNGSSDPADPEAVVHQGTTGDSTTRAVYHLNKGVYRVEFFWYERGGGDFGELYAAKGAFMNDGDTATWKLVGDNSAAQQLVGLGVDQNGWTAISSDPGGDPLNTWADADADLAATGGGSKNYDRAEIGDPNTNGGVLAFPKDTALDDDDWAVKATATLVVPADGTYLIGFNSDDGAYVKITGKTFTEILQNNTGLSAINGDSVTCDCLTGDSGTTATITLTKGNYPIEAGSFDRGGGGFLRVRGSQVGNPPLTTGEMPILAKNSGAPFTTAVAIHLTDAPTGSVGGPPSLSITRAGNTLTIQWTGTGGALESSPTLGTTANWTQVGTANPATVTIGTGKGVFYRVKQ